VKENSPYGKSPMPPYGPNKEKRFSVCSKESVAVQYIDITGLGTVLSQTILSCFLYVEIIAAPDAPIYAK